MITKHQFIRAAEIVKAIRDGAWTSELPSWAPEGHGYDYPSGLIEVSTEATGNLSTNHVRAVWTAEVFILLFREDNPRFDQARFLDACGLGPKPVAKRRV